MTHQILDIPGPNGAADAHFFTPDGDGSWPGVIIYTDIFGSRPDFEAMAQRLASHGFAVLLPNIYYRMGRAPLPRPPGAMGTPEFMEGMGRLRSAVPPPVVQDDMALFLAWLAGNPQVSGTKVGLVGYCLSGGFVLRGAADFPDRVAAAAAFHGGNLATDAPDSPHLGAPRITGKLMLGYATEDASMPVEMIARLEAALTDAGVDFEAKTYPGRHGFAVDNSHAYDKPSAEAHWEALVRFLKDNVKG